MKLQVSRISSEAERFEFETVEASLARTPRLQQLLRYMAARYFANELDQLTEYNIATEVFGRKKTEFTASEDAIARVETHRLRKKLAAYYDAEGKDHAVQITVPLGTYVPAFVQSSESSAVGLLEEQSEQSNAPQVVESALPSLLVEPPAIPVSSKVEISDAPQPPERRSSGRWLGWGVALVVLLLAGVFGLVRKRRPAIAQDVAAPVSSDPHSSSGAPVAPVQLPFRVIAGYDGAAPQHDAIGQLWSPDTYFHGGWAHRQPQAFIAGTSNPVLFQHGRNGDFTYDIPLAPGFYELHLFFMQGSDTAQSEDAENKAIFNVSINDVLTLRNFDIVSDAMGRSVGDERIFRGVVPAPDGSLHLKFSTVLGTPSVSAIEIVPGSALQQNPIRLVMSPTLYTSSDGKLWDPDNYFLHGRYLAHNLPSTNVAPETLSFERYGHFTYALPVDPRDRYTVILHFAELYFGTPQSDLHETRMFRVLCNGQTLLDDFDIAREAGDYHMVLKAFHHLKPTAQGKLNLDFEPISNYATVSAIEVVDEAP